MNTKNRKLKVLERVQDRRSMPLSVFLLIIIIGYTLFFTSKIWFQEGGCLIDATPFYQKINYGSYEIYLTEWEYSQSAKAMQVILEFENKDIMDADFQYQAVERSTGELKVHSVLEEHEYTVLRIEGIEQNWKEVSLRIGEKGSENLAKFYTNKDVVENVAALPEKSEAGYKIERLKAQQIYDDVLLKNKNREIAELLEANSRLEQKVQELEGSTYFSEDELKKAEETISKAKSQMQLNEDNMQSLSEEKDGLEKRSGNIRMQIAELEKSE